MDLLLQFQADVLRRPGSPREGARDDRARARRRLAGLAEGVWSADEVAGPDVAGAVFSPGDVDRAEAGYREWRRAVQRSLRWADAGSDD